MSGSWQLHPILSSFPSVGFVIAFVLEIFRTVMPKRANSGSLVAMIGLGLAVAVLGTAGAYFSGTSAAESASQSFTVPDAVIAWHHTWGRMLLFAALPTMALFFIAERAQFYRSAFCWGFRVMLVVCVGLCVVTAHLGGELVFEHGAGVSVGAEIIQR